MTTGAPDDAQLRDCIEELLRTGDPRQLTERKLRRLAEQKLGLDENLLDGKQYRKIVREVVEEFLQANSRDGTPSQPDEPAIETEKVNEKKRKGSDVEERERSADEGTQKKTKRKVRRVIDSDDEDDTAGIEVNVRKAGPVNESDRPKSEDDEDAPEPSGESKKPPKTTKKESSIDVAISQKDAEKIKSLQNYVAKCGVRKMWKREFEGLNGKQRIKRLEEILRELGMEGRPTLDKCKKIKERREFEEERASLDLNNIIAVDSRPGRTTRTRRGAFSPEVHDKQRQSSDSRDIEAALRRLGDPDDSDDE
ncbi:HIRA-interacting protein 3 [Quaeritorhiza haematococci]|nr:HIRA-interacting protein 3 [Quaeritorhiza haematococci]